METSFEKPKPRIAIGTDDFYKIISRRAVYVDKTLLIKEIIEDISEVSLITRPRRWGKSLNLSMLQYFFSPKVGGQVTAGLFDQLQIANVDGGRYLKEHQGKYPVIFISFKDVQGENFEDCYKKIVLLIKQIYDQFATELGEENIARLGMLAKQTFIDILQQRNPDRLLIEQSLLMFSEYLFKHYGKETYILIDEYDKPLNAAYGKEHFNQLSDFMRNIFSSCLKGNPYLKKGIMTGVLRISKGTMLSGLNNLNEISLLDKRFEKYFGFTSEEVTELLVQQGLKEKAEEIKNWYNGYKIGDLIIYNPWSIMKCLEQQGELGPYWVNTTDDNLIKQTLITASPEIKEQLLQLMQDKSITVKINKHITFDSLTTNDRSLWSLLLFTGYLKTEEAVLDPRDNSYNCQVKIPNREIMGIYNSFMINWFSNTVGGDRKYELFINKLVRGEVESFTEDIGAYLLTCASIYDVSRQPEAFYHGFVLALLASLQATHLINSNRESGLGRYDIMVIPKRKGNGDQGIILEFKHAKENQSMETVAKGALKQIDEFAYEEELKKHDHVKIALKIGMAFSGKAMLSVYTTTDLAAQKTSDLRISEELSLEEEYVEQIKQLSPTKPKASVIVSSQEDMPTLPLPKYRKRRLLTESDERLTSKSEETEEAKGTPAKKPKIAQAYEGHNVFAEMEEREGTGKQGEKLSEKQTHEM